MHELISRFQSTRAAYTSALIRSPMALYGGAQYEKHAIRQNVFTAHPGLGRRINSNRISVSHADYHLSQWIAVHPEPG
jgi:hypothetical protein